MQCKFLVHGIVLDLKNFNYNKLLYYEKLSYITTFGV